MEDILNTIGETIGGFFANPIVTFALQAIAVYIVILWLAAAYWAFRDMQLRSENPVLPYLAAALIVLFTPVLFVFGVIVYRIVRPQEKIGEVYERNLAEEALLAEVESIKTCPACHRRIQDEWIICPSCRTRLNRVCANCGRLVGLDWSLCAWCGKDFERGDIAAYEPIAPRARGPGPARRTGLPQRPLGSPWRLPADLAPLRVRRAWRAGSRLGALTQASDGGPVPPLGEDPIPANGLAPDADHGDPVDVEDPGLVEAVISRPGVFSLEGRAVPGLYLVGWVASLLGGGLLFISFAANVSGASGWLFLAGSVLLGIGLIAATGSQAIERARRPELAYRGPSPVLTFLVVVAFTFVALILVLGPLAALGLDARSPVATTVNLLITTLLYLGVIRLLVVGPGSLSWREMGVVRPGAAQVRDLLIGAIFALPVLVVTIALGLVLSRFLVPAPSPLPESAGLGGLLANLLSAAVLAPVGEEIFFRGFATTAWARSSGARSAIVRGAIFFALAHVVTLTDATFAEGAQRALYSFIALLPVSVALGWLFLARRSLYAAIGLHAAFNAIQVLLVVAAAGAIRPG